MTAAAECASAGELAARAVDAYRAARVGPEPLPDRAQVHAEIDAMVRRLSPLLGAGHDEVVDAAVALLCGLGPLEALLRDPEVGEVMVNGPNDVWIERCGVLHRVDASFSAEQIERVIERMLAPLSLRADRLHPIVDARLADGARVHVVLPPLAVDGPYLTVRRFRARRVALDEFADDATCARLRRAVRARRSIVVSGATGSGKTTLLNALVGSTEPGERLVTIEDTAELNLDADHVVRLEARPPTVEGLGEITVRDLVRAALRMRPDRIIVGEVRGAEALDMVHAMSTGHAGSLSTVHADSAADALVRLETMVMMAGVGLPFDAVRTMLRRAVHLVVHVERQGGARRVVELLPVEEVLR